MKKDTIFAWVLGVVLVVIFVVVAVALNRHSSTQPNQVAQTTQPAQQTAVQQNLILTDPKFQDVLTATPASTTYDSIVAAQKVPTSVIHIAGCRPYPEVSAVTLGQVVKMYNTDAVARTLKGSTGSGFSVTIPAKGSISYTFKGADASAFNYTCNGAAAGAIVTSN